MSAQSIRRNRLIEPFHEKAVHESTGMSWGLSGCGYDIRVREDVVLHRGIMQLASTLERFRMFGGAMGVVHDRSTLARLGLAVQNTVIEPGWEGFLTLELSYHGPKDLMIIQAGQPIAQVVFHWLDTETEQPYVGKYQGQGPEPVEAKYENVT